MNTLIIVPTDFSAASVSAAAYAADFATAINAQLALVHIWHYPMISDVPVSADFIDQLIQDATDNIEQARKDLIRKTSGKLSVTASVREGFFINEMQSMCAEQADPIVIMGAHVTTNTERIIFGSTILSAVRNLTCPLIIVPNGTRFTGIHVAGLACDLRDVPRTVHTHELHRLFNQFHPTLNVLHVSSTEHGMLDEEEVKGSNWLKSVLGAYHPAFHFIQDKNVSEAIKEFAGRNNLDLLVIIPKKHGLFNRLLHKSQSKQMVINTRVPILSVHE